MTGRDWTGLEPATSTTEAWAILVLLALTWCAFTAAYWLCGWLDGKGRVR